MALREFTVLDIEEGGNPILEGKVKKLKWLKPQGTYKPRKPNFYRFEPQNNLLAPGTKTAGMVYLANMFKELMGDPVLDTSHYMLGILHSVRRRETFFNGNLLMRDVLGYKTYDKITKVRGELIVVLLINDIEAAEEKKNEAVEDSFYWEAPEPRYIFDEKRTAKEAVEFLDKEEAARKKKEKEEKANSKKRSGRDNKKKSKKSRRFNGFNFNFFKKNEKREKRLKEIKNERKFYKLNPKWDKGEEELDYLLDYAMDLTELALTRELPAAIGREAEIDEVISVLCRKTKPNPLLIGEPGVGKTAIAEGLALRLAKTQIPEFLDGVRLFAIDTQKVVAGSKYRGDMEDRLVGLIEEAKGRRDILLFVDEIHAFLSGSAGVIGGGGSFGVGDFLKPYLAKGEISIIGATTLKEYKEYIEVDVALARRFRIVEVGEPSLSASVQILTNVAKMLENHYNMVISEQAIEAAVNLPNRYIQERFLPDKAIDLLDEACSLVFYNRAKSLPISQERRVLEAHKTASEMIDRLRHELWTTSEPVIVEDVYRPGVYYKLNPEKLEEGEESEIRQTMSQLEEQCWLLEKELALLIRKAKQIEVLNSAKIKFHDAETKVKVVEEDVAKVVSLWCGVPITQMSQDETEKYKALESILHKRVIGQDNAVVAVSSALHCARLNLKAGSRPAGSFIFAGPTGTGKTELAKAVAKFLFGTEDTMIRLDMSEYKESHTISKLIGSPPGYIGFSEGGQLTEAVRRKPYSLCLLDEIEKAHVSIYDVLLQLLDDGRLTDGSGRTIDFTSTIVIMTSNLGTSKIWTKYGKQIHMRTYKSNPTTKENMQKIVKSALKAEEFRQEFVNRLDGLIVFDYLTKENLSKILTIFLAKLKQKLNETLDLNLHLLPSARDVILQRGVDASDMGARPLRREIEAIPESGLTKGLLNGEISKGSQSFCYYEKKTESLKLIDAKKYTEKKIGRKEDIEFVKKEMKRVEATKLALTKEEENGENAEGNDSPPNLSICVVPGTAGKPFGIEEKTL